MGRLEERNLRLRKNQVSNKKKTCCSKAPEPAKIEKETISAPKAINKEQKKELQKYQRRFEQLEDNIAKAKEM